MGIYGTSRIHSLSDALTADHKYRVSQMYPIRHLALAVCLMGGEFSFATTNDGTIGDVYFHSSNTEMLFRLYGVVLDGCATTNRYGVDVSTDQGKAIASAILSAKASNATVRVVGKGVCSIHLDSEDVNYIILK